MSLEIGSGSSSLAGYDWRSGAECCGWGRPGKPAGGVSFPLKRNAVTLKSCGGLGLVLVRKEG